MKKTFNTISLFILLTGVASCDGQSPRPPVKNTGQSLMTSMGAPVPGLGKDIRCIFQDQDDNYWFASNGEGVYRFDGKVLTRITEKDGLCSNFVWTIQQDANGELWFSTRDGICSFNGIGFTDYTSTVKHALPGKLRYTKGGLFFGHFNGVCFYDGETFTNFVIQPDSYSPPAYDMNRPYDIYSTLVDKAGNVWFGTQSMGVCRYDGHSFAYLTEKDLAGPAVRTIFQDKAGVFWFGNNGGGLFRYDGKTLRNITEESGLGNHEFLRDFKPVDKPGSLARVWSINEDAEGNLWIGTIDAGLWKYDGSTLVNYTTEDGLAGNSIWAIYKDKQGELWFVTNGDAVCKRKGGRFYKYEFH